MPPLPRPLTRCSLACLGPVLAVLRTAVGFPIAGMVAGMLFVLAGLFSFLAIPELGLAVGQGVG